MIPIRCVLAFSISTLTVPLTTHAADLAQVEAPGHPPLHIDRSTVKRDGASIAFTYVLDTGGGSNSIGAVIDCEARTYALNEVRVHSEPAGQGTARDISTPPESQHTLRRIGERSTWDFLAKAMCTQ